MGNSNHHYQFLYSDWQLIHKGPRFDVYLHMNLLTQVQVYSLESLDKETQMAYEWRRTHPHPNVVQLLHCELLNKSHEYLCHVHYSAKVVLERTPLSLPQFRRSVNNRSVFTLAEETLLGFRFLYLQFGSFLINEDMIRLGHNHVVKVWLNTNFTCNQPMGVDIWIKTEQAMVERLFAIFQIFWIGHFSDRKRKQKFDQALEYLLYKKKNPKIFESIHPMVESSNDKLKKFFHTETKPIMQSNFDHSNNTSGNSDKKSTSFTYSNPKPRPQSTPLSTSSNNIKPTYKMVARKPVANFFIQTVKTPVFQSNRKMEIESPTLNRNMISITPEPSRILTNKRVNYARPNVVNTSHPNKTLQNITTYKYYSNMTAQQAYIQLSNHQGNKIQLAEAIIASRPTEQVRMVCMQFKLSSETTFQMIKPPVLTHSEQHIEGNPGDRLLTTQQDQTMQNRHIRKKSNSYNQIPHDIEKLFEFKVPKMTVQEILAAQKRKRLELNRVSIDYTSSNNKNFNTSLEIKSKKNDNMRSGIHSKVKDEPNQLKNTSKQSYSELRADLGNLLQSRVYQEPKRTIEQKIKQKRNNFADLKMEAARLLNN